MPSILSLLLNLTPVLAKTPCRQLALIIQAMLAMTGRISQLGISRWTQTGGSHRTIHRFFQTPIDWPALSWRFFERFSLDLNGVYLLAGDETVISKSGKHTHGIDRFFASLFDKAIPSIACFSLALIDVNQRRAYSLSNEQILRSPEEKEATDIRKKQAQQLKEQRKLRAAHKSAPLPQGRPKGTKSKDKAQVALNPELLRILGQSQRLLAHIGQKVKLSYMVLDGHFGNHCAAAMVGQLGLHLITKMRSDSALYLQMTPAQKRAHPRQRYGDKLDYDHLPEELVCSCQIEGGSEMRRYQVVCWHKEFAQRINVVILVRRCVNSEGVASGRVGHIVLMSTDLCLAGEQMVDYYTLRFQIEFTFRDAKQHFGLEDFMGVTPAAVGNAIGLPLFLVTFTSHLLSAFGTEHPGSCVADLKSFYRGRHYLDAFVKVLAHPPDSITYARLLERLGQMGSIHGGCCGAAPRARAA